MINNMYSNGFRIAVSPTEVQIVFRIDTPKFDEEDKLVGVVREDLADVRMSPALTKKLRDSLDQQIIEYERVFGEIKMGDL